MKDIREYIIESIGSKRTGKYAPEPTKKSFVKWLEDNRFDRYEYAGKTEEHLVYGRKTFMMGPNNERIEATNWISIHIPSVPYMHEVVIWFDKNDHAKEAEMRFKNDMGKEFPVEEVIEKIVAAVQ